MLWPHPNKDQKMKNIILHRYNVINHILNSNNQWINERHLIFNAFEHYYTNPFLSVSPSLSKILQDLIPLQIIVTKNLQLKVVPLGKKTSQTPFNIGSYKSLRPNEMMVTFFKRYWSIV